MKRIFPIVFLLLTVTSSFTQTDSNKNPILTDKFLIRGALFVPLRSVEAGVKGDFATDELDVIDFDETFGLGGTQNTFNIDFIWRFSKSKFWSVRAQTFRIAAEGDAVLDEDIEWEDVIFQSGSAVNAGYGLTLYRFFFGRVISTGQKHELGGGLGIHGLNTNSFVEGNAFVNDQPIGFSREEVKVFLPLPNIGIWYIWAPSQKWAVTAAVDWFGITIGNISGGLWNVSPGVTFQAFKNIGFSANYHYLNYYATIEQDSWNGSFDMTFKGPSFGVTANF